MDKSPRALSRARTLRRDETEAERKLWGYLRNRSLAGFKFRRQVPIPPYIADFACLSRSLIVEVDGVTHGEAHEVQYDERRTQFFQTKEFTVHRVDSVDILTNMSDALDGILIVLKKQRSR
jgi:very-short-patch-repair endonuclease